MSIEELKKHHNDINRRTNKKMFDLYRMLVLTGFALYMISDLMNRMEMFFITIILMISIVGHFIGRIIGLKEGYALGAIKTLKMAKEEIDKIIENRKIKNQ